MECASSCTGPIEVPTSNILEDLACLPSSRKVRTGKGCGHCTLAVSTDRKVSDCRFCSEQAVKINSSSTRYARELQPAERDGALDLWVVLLFSGQMSKTEDACTASLTKLKNTAAEALSSFSDSLDDIVRASCASLQPSSGTCRSTLSQQACPSWCVLGRSSKNLRRLAS